MPPITDKEVQREQNQKINVKSENTHFPNVFSDYTYFSDHDVLLLMQIF